MDGNETGYDRAREWLTMFGECNARLRDVESLLTELDTLDDDMRAQRFDLPNVHGGDVSDRLGRVIVSRTERRAELAEERELLALATANARRFLHDVAGTLTDAGAVKGYAYVLARRVHGRRAKDAARLLGLPRTTAAEYERRFVLAMVDAEPDRFTREQLPFGWYEFARGEAGGRK